MALQRFIIELGMGTDMHGGNVTKAAVRAVKDAVSRSCLCGLFDIFKFTDPNAMRIRLHIACPTPARLERQTVVESIPFGQVDLEVQEGGMLTKGLKLPQLGEGEHIVVALASLTVLVDTELYPPR